MPIWVLFTSLKHKLSVVQSSSKNLDLSRLLLCVISCDSVIEMYHATLANQRPENQRATNEKRDNSRCFSLWLYKILWEVAILRLDCTSPRARAYSFTFILNRKERGEWLSPGLTSYDVSITNSTRVSADCWPVVSAMAVFVFWHSGCQIVSHFDEFGNNPWRADDQASLHWHHYITRHAMLRQPGTRIHFKILIIIGHLTNNDHYWISEFSDRKKVTRFKIH